MKKKPIQKPNFWRMLAGNGACLFLIAVIVCGIVTWIVNCVYGLVRSENEYDKYLTMKERVISNYDESAAAYEQVRQKLNPDRTKEDEWIVKQHISYLAKQDVGSAAIVFDEKKEALYDTADEGYVFLNIREERGEGAVNAWYEAEKNPAWEELYEKCAEFAKDCSVRFLLGDVYLQGRNFCPGVVRIVTDDAERKVLWETDMTPENKAEYAHIVLDNIKWFYFLSADFGVSVSERAIRIAEEGAAQLSGGEWESYGNYDVLTFTYVQADAFSLSDGREVIFAYGARFNIFYEYKTPILLAYLAAAVLVLVLSVCLTFSRYNKQKALYEIEQYRRNLTDAMAHDLKTPLMAISGYAENISENISPEKNSDYLASIQANTAYMNRMITDILELSKAENASGRPVKEETDLAGITQEILRKYQVLSEEKKLSAEASGSCTISANPLYMRQALENLIGNALKYAEEDGIIRIEMSDKSWQITNRFSGMPDVPAEELTQPFVKGAGSRTRQKGCDGTGLGLSIAKAMLEQQGYVLKLSAENGIFTARIEL